MFSLNELAEQIESYRRGRVPLAEFQQWFEEAATGEAYDDPNLAILFRSLGRARFKAAIGGRRSPSATSRIGAESFAVEIRA